MKKISLSLLCAAVLLGGCEPTIANRGDILDKDALADIKAGATTREEVATKLGTPTSISTFDEKVWYYVGRETEQYSFLSPTILKQQAIEVDFDEQGIVTAVKNLDLSQAADANPVERSTPTYGQNNTFLKELFGDLSHPMPDLKNSHGGNGNGT